jgi:hypothetical protein
MLESWTIQRLAFIDAMFPETHKPIPIPLLLHIRIEEVRKHSNPIFQYERWIDSYENDTPKIKINEELMFMYQSKTYTKTIRENQNETKITT